jgi:hypothetical protein
MLLHRHRSHRRLQHHQGRLLPDGFGPCAAHMAGEPQQQLDRLLGAVQENLHQQLPGGVSHPIYKNINRAIIYAPGSSHAYIQQNHQDITIRISKQKRINYK